MLLLILRRQFLVFVISEECSKFDRTLSLSLRSTMLSILRLEHCLERILPSLLRSTEFCTSYLRACGWLANESPLSHISWRRPWKTHSEETGSWRRSNLIFRACAQENNWLPPQFAICEGLWRAQSEAGGSICISLQKRQLKPGKSWAPRYICLENLHRDNNWCLSERTPLSTWEALCSQEQLEDNTEINQEQVAA